MKIGFLFPLQGTTIEGTRHGLLCQGLKTIARVRWCGWGLEYGMGCNNVFWVN